MFKNIVRKNDGVVLLNNAATTPPFEKTLRDVNNFFLTYGAFHRGAGPHAETTYQKVYEAISIIKKFISVPSTHELLFTQNTSAAINLFARLLELREDDVVIASDIEHTSNALPWKFNTKAQVVEIKTFDDGSFDYTDLEEKAKLYSKNLKLIALTGAGNQTGYVPDIKKLSDIAHKHNAILFIDAAQLAPHREINMLRDGIDITAFSAHKVYAPFGLGVLALPRKLLEKNPVDPGGGSIDMITSSSILWANEGERHQTGTWNVTGIIALASSCKSIMKMGWKEIEKHEQELLKYLVTNLAKIDGLKMHIPVEKYIDTGRVPCVSFSIDGLHYALVSSLLENEYKIETRAGTICNHRLVRRWFHISDEEQIQIENQIREGNRLASYGVVRISIGFHNTKKDIDKVVAALKDICGKKDTNFQYRQIYKPVPNQEIFIRK